MWMRRLTLALVLIVSALVGGACASAGGLNRTVYELTEEIVDATEQLYANGTITEAQFRQASLLEHEVAVAGSVFTAIQRSRGGITSPTDVKPLLDAVQRAITGLRQLSTERFDGVLDLLARLEARARAFIGAN